MNLRGLLVPADDAPAPVEIERPFKGVPLGADDGIVAIGKVVVLQKAQPPQVKLVEPSGLVRVPEHVVVAAQQDLPPRQGGDIAQILLTFSETAPPAVIAEKQKRVVFREQRFTVLFECFLVVFPDPFLHLRPRLQRRGKVKVQISDGIQTHGILP